MSTICRYLLLFPLLLLAAATAPLCRQPGGISDAPVSVPRNGGYKAHYVIRLSDVTCDRDRGFVQGISADKFQDMDGVPYTRYRYNDDIMSITWYVSENAFNFTLVNKTDSILAIQTNKIFARDWDDYPTRFGYSLDKPYYPAKFVVQGKSFFSGLLVPMYNYPDKPLLSNTFPTRKWAELESRKRKGKKYQMLFPVSVGAEVYNYRFTFVVDGVSAITEISGPETEQEEEETEGSIRSNEIEFFTLSGTSKERKAESTKTPAKAAQNPNFIYAPLLGSNEKPTGTLAELLKRVTFINYFNRLCPQEKVYLHLDNTAYFQGETVWFAANIVNAAGGEAASKVLYVELLSPTGVVLKQLKLKVTDGRCHGSFPLIDTDVEEAVALRGAIGYPSGYYQIRAYTRAMLNFDDAGVFSRVIPVYKAPKEEGDYADPVMRQYSGKETNRPEPDKADKPKALNMQFFPEGGHLIAGTECRIAFKATDEHGHGVDVERLTEDNGSALAVPLQHNGMGSFLYLTTDEKNARSITARYEGKDYTFRLPVAERQGCALQINPPADGETLVNVSSRALGADSVLAYTITHQGRVCAFDTLHLAPPKSLPVTGINVAHTQFSLPPGVLPVGVCQFTLYNPAGNVLAQRLFFVDGELPTQTVSVTSEKADIHPFDEIRLNFQTSYPASSTFSLAVRDAADYGTAYRDDIRTYMLLSSELKGLIEDPGWYFERLSDYQTNRLADNSPASEPSPKHSSDSLKSVSLKSKKDALDLLMLVQGWTRYNWRQMAGVEPFEIRHYTESQLVVDGWAFSRIRETPLADVKIAVRLTSLDRQHQQETTVTTDSLGYWSVGVEDFEGEWDLYMETRQQGDKSGNKTTRVRLERSSKPALYAYTPLETWLPAYTWSLDSMLTVEEAEDPEYQLPTDSHLLQEVEVTGRRKYIDYYTFKAFDAAKDAELILDEGNYTSKVEDYLREKGFEVQVSLGDVGDATRASDYPIDIDTFRLEYYKDLLEAAPINNHRTFWYIHEGKSNRTSPSYFAGYAIDLEEVKSIIVYDDPWIYKTFPGLTDLLTPSEIRYVTGEDELIKRFASGVYVVDIELNPARKRRTYVDKNARSTSFSGYSPVVEFYAPTYPNGPIQGDKDYRRTIYWNPEVTTDADGRASVSFYNNGYSRALTVSAEGLTNDGVPIINK